MSNRRRSLITTLVMLPTGLLLPAPSAHAQLQYVLNQALTLPNGAGTNTQAVALADFDGDGDLDAVVANSNFGAPKPIYLNDGTGVFANGQSLTGGITEDVEAADVDNDGDVDIIFGSFRSGNNLWLWRNNGDGTFVSDFQPMPEIRALALGDIDGDGDVDGVGVSNSAIRVLRNNGSGGFSSTSFGGSGTFMDAQLADLDHDGDLDLVLANFGQTNPVYLNDGSGSFALHQSLAPGGLGFSRKVFPVGDVNGDGHIDIVEHKSQGPERVWLNDGVANFTLLSTFDAGNGQVPFTTLLGDLDLDGDLDVVAYGQGGTQPIFLNQGDGHFTAYTNPGGAIGGMGAALGDFDGDGDLDLFAGRGGYDGAASISDLIYFNTVPPPVTDTDGDGVDDDEDNCPLLANAGQEDLDADGLGDACDEDRDGDGIANDADAFPDDATEWADSDGDGIGDNADPDDDNDGQSDEAEAACGSDPLDAASTSPDNDADNVPDCVDPDDDNDSIEDATDNCPLVTNADQADFDNDGTGDVCDPDVDGDLVENGGDLCALTIIPESVPTVRLNPNHFALTGADGVFDTVTKGKGNGPARGYTTSDTGGCSCEQIIEAQGLGEGHKRYGCSISAMDDWVALIGAASKRGGPPAAIDDGLPGEYTLETAYPNPFNPTTTLRFALPEAGVVQLVVYDALGRDVARLVNGRMDAGRHSVTFDAAGLPSGVYLARFSAGSVQETRSLLLLK